MVRLPFDPFGVDPERLHFLVFNGRTSLHPPMDIGHGAILLFRLVVTLLIALTGALRGRGPVVFSCGPSGIVI